MKTKRKTRSTLDLIVLRKCEAMRCRSFVPSDEAMERVGMTYQQFSNLRSGQTSISNKLPIEQLQFLADFYDTSIHYLLFGKDELPNFGLEESPLINPKG